MARRAEDLIAAGPPGGGDFEETEGPRPIGIPPEAAVFPGENPAMRAALDAAGAQVEELPRQRAERGVRGYFDGDEYVPSRMSPTEIARLQRQLEAGGVIPRGARYRLGVWDETSRNAYRDLLGFANGAGIRVDEALRRYAEGVAMNEETEAPNLPTYRVSNPNDLRSVFQKAAQSIIGRTNLDPAQIEQMISAYQQQELAPQQAITGNQQAGGGGTVVEAMDPTVFAEQQIRQAAPVEAGAHDQVAQFDSFLDIILNGPGGQ